MPNPNQTTIDDAVAQILRSITAQGNAALALGNSKVDTAALAAATAQLAQSTAALEAALAEPMRAVDELVEQVARTVAAQAAAAEEIAGLRRLVEWPVPPIELAPGETFDLRTTLPAKAAGATRFRIRAGQVPGGTTVSPDGILTAGQPGAASGVVFECWVP